MVKQKRTKGMNTLEKEKKKKKQVKMTKKMKIVT